MANVGISNLEVGCTIVNYCKFDWLNIRKVSSDQKSWFIKNCWAWINLKYTWKQKIPKTKNDF